MVNANNYHYNLDLYKFLFAILNAGLNLNMLFSKYLNINFSLSENSCQERIKKIASATFRSEVQPKLKKVVLSFT